MPSYIVSLPDKEIKVISQLLHMGMLQEMDNDYAESALETLRVQTNIVYKDAEKHNIYENPVTAPARAVKFNGAFYIPVV